ncbi:hypothetical protein [Adhaeribacter pallidiroseus]|uniref:Uncharacterized protein n=1 Tax=Adhaeribacter pallidiroseus TaxID=2072847 RepID=A0A369QFK4_9BACT|nr:hypothetical protein [Adhaeribacter pallidiroseus]RDC63701.1 hypothetical protein AHMF7616_02309 [Adhaeribacter pallidiroseus]
MKIHQIIFLFALVVLAIHLGLAINQFTSMGYVTTATLVSFITLLGLLIFFQKYYAKK